jgi:hypothetical protein
MKPGIVLKGDVRSFGLLGGTIPQEFESGSFKPFILPVLLV